MSRPSILIVEAGSQTTQLIGRVLREKGLRSATLDPKRAARWIESNPVKGVIISGGPKSVYEEDAVKLPEGFLKLLLEKRIPLLGICYGMQLIAHTLGGRVESIEANREYGPALAAIDPDSPLFHGLHKEEEVWTSHGDTVTALPEGFEPIGWQTTTGAVTAMASSDNLYFGVQFHPEVTNTPNGAVILCNFAFRICGCERDWEPSSAVEALRKETLDAIAVIEKERGVPARVIMGYSAGVDSSSTAALLAPVLGERLLLVTIDAGQLREGEIDEIREAGKRFGCQHIIVDAKAAFLAALAGIEDAEEKRKTFTALYTRRFDELAEIFGANVFIQGTLATDLIESGATGGEIIKSHHNVGVEIKGCVTLSPLRNHFKYEVREIGKELGLPPETYNRQPFPGPGLFIRILGAVNEERLACLRAADAIAMNVIKQHGEYDARSQALAMLLTLPIVGVKGDKRVYGWMIIVRAVDTIDFMTASAYDFSTACKAEVTAQVSKLNNVVGALWDVTPKPSRTTEGQ